MDNKVKIITCSLKFFLTIFIIEKFNATRATMLLDSIIQSTN